MPAIMSRVCGLKDNNEKFSQIEMTLITIRPLSMLIWNFVYLMWYVRSLRQYKENSKLIALVMSIIKKSAFTVITTVNHQQ